MANEIKTNNGDGREFAIADTLTSSPTKVPTSKAVAEYVAANAGGGAWGDITGTLSAQIDLQSALNAKQATLVSATNIKTVNGSSLVGSGDVVVSGGDYTFVIKASNETLSNSNVMQDDDELYFTATANKVYSIVVSICHYCTGSERMGHVLQIPSFQTGIYASGNAGLYDGYYTRILNATTSANEGTYVEFLQSNVSDTAPYQTTTYRLTLYIGATGGTVKYRFKGLNGSGNTVVRKGSFIAYKQLD